jgi:hypothetical protein
MNKENLASELKQVNNSFPIVNEEIRKVEQVNETRKVSNEEALLLYYNYQAVQAMKSRVDTLFDAQYEEEDIQTVTYEDIRELNKKLNRKEYIENYQNDNVRIQGNKSSIEIWA